MLISDQAMDDVQISSWKLALLCTETAHYQVSLGSLLYIQGIKNIIQVLYKRLKNYSGVLTGVWKIYIVTPFTALYPIMTGP